MTTYNLVVTIITTNTIHMPIEATDYEAAAKEAQDRAGLLIGFEDDNGGGLSYQIRVEDNKDWLPPGLRKNSPTAYVSTSTTENTMNLKDDLFEEAERRRVDICKCKRLLLAAYADLSDVSVQLATDIALGYNPNQDDRDHINTLWTRQNKALYNYKGAREHLRDFQREWPVTCNCSRSEELTTDPQESDNRYMSHFDHLIELKVGGFYS